MKVHRILILLLVPDFGQLAVVRTHFVASIDRALGKLMHGLPQICDTALLAFFGVQPLLVPTLHDSSRLVLE
jgi:hypothetical protein